MPAMLIMSPYATTVKIIHKCLFAVSLEHNSQVVILKKKIRSGELLNLLGGTTKKLLFYGFLY